MSESFDADRLARSDGADGRPAHVAYQGRVFDVSGSRLWKGGLHMRRHQAGRDLTAELQAAPHGPEMLERFPEVGALVAPAAPERGGLLERFPFLRRHPHPMTVHFPIVYSLSAAGFLVLARVTGSAALERTVCHCLWAGALFTPLALATGYLTWRVNYAGRPLRPVTLKRRLGWLLWATTLGAALWRAVSPQGPSGAAGAAWAGLVVLSVPLVAALGWLGAQLTFPLDKR